MRYKKIIKMACILFLFLFQTTIINNGYGYTVEINNTARWKITRYEVNVFLHMKLNDQIQIKVINVSENEINVMMTSSNSMEDEDLIQYDDTTCRPFIEKPKFLYIIQNMSNYDDSIITERYEKSVFNIKRSILSIILKNVHINDDIGLVTYYFEYDLETGVLITWNIIKSFSDQEFVTSVVLISTNIFDKEKENRWKEIINALFPYCMLLFVFGIGSFGIFISFKLIDRRKEKMMSFSFPKLKVKK